MAPVDFVGLPIRTCITYIGLPTQNWVGRQKMLCHLMGLILGWWARARLAGRDWVGGQKALCLKLLDAGLAGRIWVGRLN